MSPKEPAIRALRERYNETFALTYGSEGRIHLFLIKFGMWSLAYTFAFKDSGRDKLMPLALESIQSALAGDNKDLALRLDKGITGAEKRIESKMALFK